MYLNNQTQTGASLFNECVFLIAFSQIIGLYNSVLERKALNQDAIPPLAQFDSRNFHVTQEDVL